MKSFEQISADAAKIIATWPEWKQRTLMVQNEAKCKEREPVKQTGTDTLVQALRLLASDIHCCEEDVVTSVIREAADGIEKLSTKPACPICKAEMRPRKYEGYYDSFDYWECDCESLPDADAWQGSNNDC